LYTVGVTKTNTTTQEKEDYPMRKENNKLDFTGQDIYVGIDIGKKVTPFLTLNRFTVIGMVAGFLPSQK